MVASSPPPGDVEVDADADAPSPWLVVVGVVAVIVGVVFRFTARSALWLDEALSVNIASLPLGELTDALRHDGHPPLYYVLLHGWMEVFGSSDVAVRALAGLWAVLLIPLVWYTARELAGPTAAWCATILAALSPFAVRYGTETRMYSMMAVLALVGFLCGRAAMIRPTPLRLVGVAVSTGLLLWTHYWSMWFAGVAGLLLLATFVRRRRARRTHEAGAPLKVLGAIVVGGLTFLPWLPHLWYQSQHTGTPWARPMRPAEIVSVMVIDFGGGVTGEAAVLGWGLVFLAVAGLVARSAGPFRLDLDLRARRSARVPAALVGGTLALACVAGYASGATFASRYAAVIHPLVVVLAGIGLAQFRPRWLTAVALVGIVGLSAVGLVRNVTTERTDAARNAEAIEAVAQPGDLVAYCPDQLGPSGSRALDVELEQVTYPAFDPPERVDWVDYQERIDATDPEQFGAELLDRAAGRNLFLVYSTSYDTHRSICPALFNVLARARAPQVLAEATEAFEPSGVALFPVAAG